MPQEFAGRLRARLMIERPTPGRDASANANPGWQPRGSIWAALAAAEAPTMALAGEGRVSRPRYRITLRSGTDIGLADRLRWQTAVLRILRFEPDPAQPDRIILLAEETGQ